MWLHYGSPDDRDSGLLLFWREVSVDVGLDPDDLECCDLTRLLDCFNGDLQLPPLSLACNTEFSSIDGPVVLITGSEAGATLVIVPPAAGRYVIVW